MYKPFYIEGFTTGLERDKKDFQLLEDAFTELNDAFIYHDRISRKKGHLLVCRLTRICTAQALGNTIGKPHTGNIKTVLALEANAEIVPGSVSIAIAAPGAETFTDAVTPTLLIGTAGGTGTINYATGVYTFTSPAAWGAGQAITAAFNYNPALPCMGFGERLLSAISAEQSVAFDTRYVYFYNQATERFEEQATGITWTGTDHDFFWTSNYYSNTAAGDIFLVTNFNKSGTPDPIRYYTSAAGTWNNFLPPIDGAGNELHQCAMIFPYKGRLVALNTWEGATLAAAAQNPRRARWSQNGDALAANAWRSDIAGRGGFIDCSTGEHIVSAGFIRDTLIVGFEKSTWRLRYTNNEVLPFVWEQIDNEYGIESRFSVVKADTSQIAVSARGIIACDGLNASRVDEKIPDEAFAINNDNNGTERVHGIRDYDHELFYWTLPHHDENHPIDPIYPNKVLVFNYKNGAWSYFNDSYTCFGVLQGTTDKRWMDFPTTDWAHANFAWNANILQSLYPEIIAGNQHGFVVKPQKTVANSPSFAITLVTTGTPAMLTIPNHNLQNGDFIRVSGILGTASVLNDKVYTVAVGTASPENQVYLFNTLGPITLAAGSTYLGGGVIAWRHDYRARTKKLNFLQNSQAIRLGYIDFLIAATQDGQFNVDVFIDHNDHTPINPSAVLVGPNFFNSVVSTATDTFDVVGQNTLLHRMYCPIRATFIQLEINLNDTQKYSDTIHNNDIEIYSMTHWFAPAGRSIR